jgi:hypothetical protein
MALLSRRCGTGHSGSDGSPLPGPRPGWLVAGLLILLTLAVPSGHPPSAAETRPPGEYQIKAAFLYNFAKFIDWPAESFASESAPFTICILGDNPFGKGFDPIRSKTVKNRPVAVREIDDAASAGGCQVVFISASEQPGLRAVLEMLGHRSVLTVSDMKGFAQAGGMISFVTEDDKVRFEINLRAANPAKLKISSQLLKLARRVIE